MADETAVEEIPTSTQTYAPSNGQTNASPDSDSSARRRDVSVTFAAPLSSNGENRSDNVDVPKASRALPPRPRGRSILDEIAAQSEEESQTSVRSLPNAMSRALRYDPTTGHLVPRRQSKRERPSTHSTIPEGSPIDEPTRDTDFGQRHSRVESLTSGSTTSPDFEALETPTDYSYEFPSPPMVASSPVEIPNSFMSHISHQEPKRSITGHSGSLRRSGRRSSNRVGSTSMSPAGAFLSQWSRDDYVTPCEPDDEGQEIGDNAEYIIGRKIGYGGFSVVKEVFTIEDSERIRRAVKIVRKQIAGSSEQRNEQLQSEFEHEVSIWRCLKHPHILPLIAVFDSPFATFCITHFNSAGTLFDLVRRHRRSGSSSVNLKPYSSTDSTKTAVVDRKQIPFQHMKRYIYQTASAIRYLHQDMRIVHRDIKLENCLLDLDTPLLRSYSSLSASVSSIASMASDNNESSEAGYPRGPGDILLCDFGMADFITRDDREVFLPVASHGIDDQNTANAEGLSSPHNIGPGPTSANVSTSTNIAGSLQYASPELILASEPLYDTGIDIWAFGVLCFALLTSELPFAHGLAPKVQSKISKGEWDVSLLCECVKKAARMQDDDTVDEQTESDKALELVQGCLEMNPQRRWNIGNILECAFLENGEELYEPEA